MSALRTELPHRSILVHWKKSPAALFRTSASFPLAKSVVFASCVAGEKCKSDRLLVGKIIGEIGIEVRRVGRLDSRLSLVRFLRRGAKFRQTPFVRRIQSEKIVLVQPGHALRKLEERLTRLPHLGEQARWWRKLA